MNVLPTLRQCLIDTPVPHLRVIARMWGLEVQTKRPLEIAAELAQYLADLFHECATEQRPDVCRLD